MMTSNDQLRNVKGMSPTTAPVIEEEKAEMQTPADTKQPQDQEIEDPGESLDGCSSDGCDDDKSCRDEEDYYAFLREMAGSFEATYDDEETLECILSGCHVYYRFAHKSQVLEKIEFYGKEIAIGDLRHTIAEKQKLPKVDLQILNESTGEVYTRDGHLLRPNVIVTVRRTPIQTQKKPAVLNLEGADILSRVKRAKIAPQPKPEPVPEEKAPCPPEYLCSLCTGLFEPWPDLHGKERKIRSCDLSMSSFRQDFGDLKPQADVRPLPNPRLADIIASLNLDFFELPAVTAAG
ncbi:unnamed protein product [Symbiodinium sp. CCMP2592]|nr:unnamed protein product [Symbiodinium sp. CCMP2592]